MGGRDPSAPDPGGPDPSAPGTGVRIQPATEAQYAVAGAICVEAYRADGQLHPDYAPVLADVAGRSRHGEILVAVSDRDADRGTVLGCVTFVLAGTRYAEISGPGEGEFRMLAVDPAAQRRGVGFALARACVERATELGCAAVAICTRDINEAALRMYRRLGFRRVPDRDWAPRPGMTLVALRLDLPGRTSGEPTGGVDRR